jgi:cytidine deaminase
VTRAVERHATETAAIALLKDKLGATEIPPDYCRKCGRDYQPCGICRHCDRDAS